MKRIKQLLKKLGPGFVTGASDDDPSGIATYAQTGAQFGYSLLWTPLFSFTFMSAVQEMCGRIGLVTGKGIAGVIRQHHSRKTLYLIVTLVFIANTINLGANLGAMASATRLILPLPQMLLILIFVGVSVILMVTTTYKTYSNYLKYLAFFLIAYIFAVFSVEQDWKSIFYSALVPQIEFSTRYLTNLIAILGATISPYLFFWQAGEEVEEEVESHKIRMMGHGIPKVSRYDIRNMRLDTIIGMGFSNIVMFFIITIFASTLNANGIFFAETADQAALALRPFAGEFAFSLFAIGLVGAGMLSIPVLAGSASYAVSEAFKWNEGFNLKLKKALGFYIILLSATAIGVIINLLSIPPFKLLYYTAVLNGLIAPIMLVLILKIANNKKIMKTRTNSKFSNILGITITVVMFSAGTLLLFTLLSQHSS